DEVRAFMRGVRIPPELRAEHERNLATLHAVDHLEQLVEALREPPARHLLDDPVRTVPRTVLCDALARDEAWLAGGSDPAAERMRALSLGMAGVRKEGRVEALSAAARGELDPDEALARIEALRWLDAVLYHVWRSTHHLEPPGTGSTTDSPAT